MLVTVEPPGLPETRNHSRAISAAAKPVSCSPASALSRLMARIAFTRSCAENRRAVRYETALRARTVGAYGHRRFHSGIFALSETIEAFYLVPVRSVTRPSGTTGLGLRPVRRAFDNPAASIASCFFPPVGRTDWLPHCVGNSCT